MSLIDSHILKACDLYKNYRQKEVLKGISFSIQSGEVVGLLGPNGAGKTTSFYIMVGLIHPDKGRVYLDQIDFTNFSIHKRAQHGISYLPQEASIFRKLTVNENIMAILELRKDMNKIGRLKLLKELMEEFHITGITNTLGINLSGGERRRVEIARCLATKPKFLLLDEPFAGVDPISIVDIKRLINYLSSKNIGILITDQNVRETLAICKRAYIVNNGEIIGMGSPEDILNNQIVREVYLGNEFDLPKR